MRYITLAAGALTIMTAACVHNRTSTEAGDVAMRRGTIGTIPSGTVLEGRLNHSLTPVRAKVGDAFSVKLVEDAGMEHHEALLPNGSTVYGHISRLDLNNRSGSVASVQLAFDSLVYAGHNRSLNASISKVGADRVSVSPIAPDVATGTTIPASVTLLSFADANGQIPKGSTVTLVVTNPIRLEDKE